MTADRPSDMVKVWIFTPEYECPSHYPWHGPDSPLHSSYDDDAYLIPREQYERWKATQAAWDRMNKEMGQLRGTPA